MTRVVHLVPRLFGAEGVWGGAERYAWELARHMAAVVPTTLVSFGDEDRTSREGDLTVRVLGGARRVRGQPNNPFTLRLFGALRAGDIVHCHQQHVVASSAAAVFARCTGRRVFVSDLGGGGWDVSAYVSTDAWYHGHLHISRYSRRIAGHDGRPWAHVVLGGVDVGRFRPDPGVAREDLVVFVGRLLPHKGVDDLITALPDDLPLEVIGRVADERHLADLHALAAGKRVTFRHDCDDAELIRAYRRARCVVLPSVYRTRYGTVTRIPELLGQTLLEAMACGAAVICTDVASMPEIVRHARSGLVVPPNDPPALRGALQALRSDPAAAARLGEAGRRRVLDTFTWPATVERCLEAYAA